MSTSRFATWSATAAFALLGAGTASAQDRPNAGATAPERAAPTERPNAAAGAEVERPNATVVRRQLANTEELNRLRQAKLARLRALAEAKGDSGRVDALRRLEQTQQQVFERRIQRHRLDLGNEEFDRARGAITRPRAAAGRPAAGGTAPVRGGGTAAPAPERGGSASGTPVRGGGAAPARGNDGGTRR